MSGREATSSTSDFGREVERITAENRTLLRRLAESERRFRLVSRGVLRVEEAERGRVSRELHDGLGQRLTALKIQVELLRQQAEDAGRSTAGRLQDLRELVDGALEEVRHLSRLLRPPMLDDLGLQATLEWLVRSFENRTGIRARLEREGELGDIDPDVATLAFRVVQEALTNVAKHAATPVVEVGVRRRRGGLALWISDWGVGFDSEALGRSDPGRAGLGLRGLKDRVQLFDGRLRIETAPGRGTRIEIEVPLDEDGEQPS